METTTSIQEFTRLAPDDQVEQTARALAANGIRAIVCDTAQEARAQVLSLIPASARVYNSPSRTLEQIGLAEDIQTATRFQPVRAQLQALDRATQQRELRALVTSPDILVGSVHAITARGEVLLASASGSQLGSAAAGAGQVIWVAGTQKLVTTLEDGLRRIREYCLPLEDERTRQVYGRPSAINKLLIVNADQPGRITLILVRQILGF